MSLEIKKFTETDFEFKELARIDNLVNHDSIDHPDDDKDSWKIRDRGQIRNRLLLYKNNILIGEDYGAAFGKEIKGHYGADNLMAKDINEYLINNKTKLPVGVIECMEAGIVAMKIDEARNTGKVIDLSETWNKFDNLLN